MAGGSHGTPKWITVSTLFRKILGRGLGANRVASLKELREHLRKPFVIQLNERPLREEWGRWPIVYNRGLSDADLKTVEQLVRDRGERHVIAITATRDRATVSVGDHDVFERARRYELARTDGTWRIKVESHESGW